MEIVLARHGRPQLDLWTWLTPGQLGDWLPTFNSTDLPIQDIPPDALAKVAASAAIVSSTLPRSLQSAQRAAHARPLVSDALFREADLPYPYWNLPKFPLSVWLVVFRLAWFFGYSSNAESMLLATRRASRAAEFLICLAAEHESVFLVGHGVMISLIAKQLLRRGWSGPRRPATGYWTYTVYSGPC